MNNALLVVAMVFPWLLAALAIGLVGWLGFQLVHQNGRLHARLEGLEQRLVPSPPAPPPNNWARGRRLTGPGTGLPRPAFGRGAGGEGRRAAFAPGPAARLARP